MKDGEIITFKSDQVDLQVDYLVTAIDGGFKLSLAKWPGDQIDKQPDIIIYGNIEVVQKESRKGSQARTI